MASGSGWSNIFLQLMAGDTPPKIGLPVLGEGQLGLPWTTQIELLSFQWGMSFDYKDQIKKSSGSMLGAAAGMAGGAIAGNVAGAVGGQAGIAVAAAAAAAASALMDFKEIPKADIAVLRMTKRFDLASARIQSCADNDIRIQSALVSVLHIKQGGGLAGLMHEPGFTLFATNGYFEKVDVKMEKGDKGVEVTEDLELHFKHIVVTYSKRLGANNIPMPPFVYVAPDED